MKKLINWCSLFWTSFFILIGLIFYQGYTTQLNTQIDKFNVIETTTGSISGGIAVRGSVGLNLGFTQEGLKVFLYDASAPSGSRFTEVTDFDGEFEILGDAGDRIYFGAFARGQPIRPFGIYSLPSVAKSSETMIAKYWSNTAGDLVEMQYVNLIDDCLNQNNKKIWEGVRKDYISLPKNIYSDWVANSNVLDKIPNTGDLRYWVVFEVPAGGLATPAKLTQVAYRGSGVSVLDCNQQEILWGLAKIKLQQKIFAMTFKDSGVPVITAIDVTSTNQLTTYSLRSALGDKIKYAWSMPLGIDTSMPLEIDMMYTANQAINTANILADLKIVNHIGGIIGVGQTSDYLNTSNIGITSANIMGTVELVRDFDISNSLENDLLFINFTRTDNNGGQFYPIEICINYYAYKIGKF